MSEEKQQASHSICPATWVKIGEHLDRETLKQAAEQIRTRWAGRYDVKVCETSGKSKGFELQLRHR